VSHGSFSGGKLKRGLDGLEVVGVGRCGKVLVFYAVVRL